MTPALAGIAAGAVAALGSARLLEKLVFAVSASDPLTGASDHFVLSFHSVLSTETGSTLAARRAGPQRHVAYPHEWRMGNS
jgi:hypothetical protein